MTRVKICGITNLPDANEAIAAGADYLGLVLTESPRRVDYNQLAEIVNNLTGKVATVGVFANMSDLKSFSTESNIKLDYYQTYFECDLKKIRPPQKGVIRAIWIDKQEDELPDLNDQLLLFDFKNAEKMRDKLLKLTHSALLSNLFLAGGIAVDNVSDIVTKYAPYAIDAARATEKSAGRKDYDLLHQFIRKVKDASQ